LWQGLRPRHWLKNLLVFVPMLAAHAINGATALQSLLAFAAFCLCASSAYLLNDAMDAEDDRHHPVKRHRRLPAARCRPRWRAPSVRLLALTALVLCACYGALLLAAVAVYFGATVAYSAYLKRLLMVDTVTLALLHTLRVLGGCAATGIEPSFWLLAFSFFLFLSLALLKRHSELFNLERVGKDKTAGRGYATADRAPIGMLGMNSAFVSVLIFMLYFNSENVLRLYRHPSWLFGIVPLAMLWLWRLWVLSFRARSTRIGCCT
jgi:4-hydroxybenzoate polyprenyltransferase